VGTGKQRLNIKKSASRSAIVKKLPYHRSTGALSRKRQDPHPTVVTCSFVPGITRFSAFDQQRRRPPPADP
jgi:hypothetical protein